MEKREISLADLKLEKVKEDPSIIIDAMEKGQVPGIKTTHADANTVSCMVGECLVNAGRKFHEIYVSPVDTREDIARKTSTVKEDETVILVRHMNEYTEAAMDAVWDFMFRQKTALVIIFLERKK